MLSSNRRGKPPITSSDDLFQHPAQELLNDFASHLPHYLPKPTLLVQSSNDVIRVVWKEPSVVEDRREHGCNSTGHHLALVFVLIHLEIFISRSSANQ